MSLVDEAPNYGSIGYLESDNINDYKYVKKHIIYTNMTGLTKSFTSFLILASSLAFEKLCCEYTG